MESPPDVPQQPQRRDQHDRETPAPSEGTARRELTFEPLFSSSRSPSLPPENLPWPAPREWRPQEQSGDGWSRRFEPPAPPPMFQSVVHSGSRQPQEIVAREPERTSSQAAGAQPFESSASFRRHAVDGPAPPAPEPRSEADVQITGLSDGEVLSSNKTKRTGPEPRIHEQERTVVPSRHESGEWAAPATFSPVNTRPVPVGVQPLVGSALIGLDARRVDAAGTDFVQYRVPVESPGAREPEDRSDYAAPSDPSREFWPELPDEPAESRDAERNETWCEWSHRRRLDAEQRGW